MLECVVAEEDVVFSSDDGGEWGGDDVGEGEGEIGSRDTGAYDDDSLVSVQLFVAVVLAVEDGVWGGCLEFGESLDGWNPWDEVVAVGNDDGVEGFGPPVILLLALDWLSQGHRPRICGLVLLYVLDGGVVVDTDCGIFGDLIYHVVDPRLDGCVGPKWSILAMSFD